MTARFLLSFLLGASLIILLSACGGSFEDSEEPEKTNQPVHCHPPTFVGPNPKECY